jgi:alpha-galactosidase
VTDWGKQPIKFRVDVASMGKLGFDIVFSALSENDRKFCQEAVSNYNGFKDIIWQGDQYRLVNPHVNDMASMMYVSKDKTRAVMFSFFVSNRQRLTTDVEPIRMKGLDPAKKYTVEETNRYPGARTLPNGGKVYSGDFLMKAGINPGVSQNRTSVVILVSEVK